VKRFTLFALFGILCALPLLCTTLQRLSLDDMITKSTSIVRGKVTGSYTAASGRVIYTHYTIQVTESYKGSAASTVDAAVPGGAANGLRQSFAGSPELQAGEEYVLFLWTSRSGLTQVIGLTQGIFTLSKSTSDPMATRAAGDDLLLTPGSGVPVKGETLSLKLSALRGRITSRLAAQKGATR
jgi:hypothetical protein